MSPSERPEPLLNLHCNSGDTRCESPVGPGQAIHLWIRVPGFQTPANRPPSGWARSPSRASLSWGWPCTLVSWRASAGAPFVRIQPLPNQRARFLTSSIRSTHRRFESYRINQLMDKLPPTASAYSHAHMPHVGTPLLLSSFPCRENVTVWPSCPLCTVLESCIQGKNHELSPPWDSDPRWKVSYDVTRKFLLGLCSAAHIKFPLLWKVKEGFLKIT